MISAVAPKRDGAGDHLADVDRGFVDRALPQRLVREQHVLGVEEEDADLLGPTVGHGRVQIVAERVPARQNRLPFDPRLEQPQRGGLGNLECGDGGVAQALPPSRLPALAKSSGPMPPKSLSSRLASGLVSTRGMVSVSRYSISS